MVGGINLLHRFHLTVFRCLNKHAVVIFNWNLVAVIIILELCGLMSVKLPVNLLETAPHFTMGTHH